MKKLITLILTFTLTLAVLPVEAAKSPSLDFLKTSYKDSRYQNISQNGSLSFKLNKPIAGLDFLDEMMDSSDSPVDIKALVEGLFDSTITYTTKQKTTNTGEKSSVEMQMKSSAPIRINNNLELAVNTGYSVWMDLDVKNPSMDFIMSMPMNKRYITMSDDDFAEYMDEEELTEYNEVMGMVSELYSDDLLTEMQDKMVDSISENAKVTGTARDIKIVFSDLGLKKYFADVFEIAMDIYPEEIREQLMDGSDEFIDTLKDVAINVPFFADDALVMELKLDSKNRIISEKVELNVDLDVFELISYLGEDTEGLVEGSSNVSFSMIADTDLKYNTVNIKKPELTDENSVSFTELMPQYEEPVEDDYEEYYFSYRHIDTDENFYGKNGEKYIPLRNLLEAFDYEVSYESGVISATSDSKYAEYDNITFNVKSNVVNTNTVYYTMIGAPVIINDKSYITLQDAQKIMNFTTYKYSYYPQDKYGYIGAERNATEEDFQQVDL